MNFEQLSKRIIQNSIKSSVFIDDNVVNAYENNEGADYQLSKKLFEDFRKSNCTLDIYKFENYENFESQKEFFLKRRDLLILDWDLKNECDPQYSDALKIIEQAVLTQSLHFVCIYTSTPSANFISTIYYRIAGFTYDRNDDNVKNCLIKILEITERDELEVKITGLLKEIVISPDKKEVIAAEILAEFEKQKSGCTLDIQRAIGHLLHLRPTCGFAQLGFYLNSCIVKKDECLFSIRLIDGSTFYINDTLFKIFNKDEIQANILFERFSDSLVKSRGNFMTLLGLELRNMFLDNSAFIEKEIDEINELSFFYHHHKINPKETFYDFVREIWKEQSSSFLLYKNPELLESFDEYKQEREITLEKLDSYDQSENNQKDLARLNYYYNILVIDRSKNNKIHFGDIFNVIDINENGAKRKTSKYLINITSHCDCLYPENIDQHFMFVRGSMIELLDALKKGDTGFYSYVKKDGEIIAIQWNKNPFTLFLQNEKNTINDPIQTHMGATKCLLVYEGSLKENYAQRIANNAFLNATRVGIFFADFKEN
ncbi:MAG: hypothetical protein HYZ10_03235 [Ignavibacteriales bacterium]|nr:hypothetical protein [Ignavibacteriales bacterium]